MKTRYRCNSTNELLGRVDFEHWQELAARTTNRFLTGEYAKLWSVLWDTLEIEIRDRVWVHYQDELDDRVRRGRQSSDGDRP